MPKNRELKELKEHIIALSKNMKLSFTVIRGETCHIEDKQTGFNLSFHTFKECYEWLRG